MAKKPRYCWNPGYHPNISAEVAGEELESIRKMEGGSLKPERVVEYARDERHPLHPAFTWDDTKAAEKYRRGEAANLIRAVRVIGESEAVDSPPRRVYVRIPSDRTYSTMESVRRDRPEVIADILAGAARELRSFRDRHADLRDNLEARPVFKAIDRFLEKRELAQVG